MRRGILLIVVLAVACGGGGSSPSSPSPPPTPVVPPINGAALFRAAALLGGTRQPSAGDVNRIFAKANDILFQKTGERMTLTDLATVGPGFVSSQVATYVGARSSAPPDGVLFFSDDAMAASLGGYSLTYSLPSPHENRFPSPVLGLNRGYTAVVHYFHMYARCGYDNSGNRIGTTSSGGECRNRNGLMCVNNGRYWTCPDALNDLYSDPDHFTACTVVHEFMHPFGSEGNLDHYGTQQCIARTGMSQADAANLAMAQQSRGMCPDLYARFRRQP